MNWGNKINICLKPCKSGIVRLTLHIPLQVEAIFHRCLGAEGLRFKESLLDPKVVQHRDFHRTALWLVDVANQSTGMPGRAQGPKMKNV